MVAGLRMGLPANLPKHLVLQDMSHVMVFQDCNYWHQCGDPILKGSIMLYPTNDLEATEFLNWRFSISSDVTLHISLTNNCSYHPKMNVDPASSFSNHQSSPIGFFFVLHPLRPGAPFVVSLLPS